MNRWFRAWLITACFVLVFLFLLGPIQQISVVTGQGGDPRKPKPTPTPAPSTKSSKPPPGRRARPTPTPISPRDTSVVATPSPTPTPIPTPTPTPTPTPKPTPIPTRTNQAGIEFVLIPPGRFMMGSNSNNNEKPVHEVTISQPFYMGKYEVTQGQWQAVMGSNPSNFKGGNLPVETVSWDDAIAFIARLNAQNDGYTYRLPTETEWEYACRAGTTGDYAGDLDAMGWYGNNSGRGRLDAAEIYQTDSANLYKRITENGGQTHAVGSKLPNCFGLFDMHGNVWEWCQDWYHDSYNGAPTDGSAWMSGGEQKSRVLRGGSWNGVADSSRSALRRGLIPAARAPILGFRVAAVARPESH